MAKCPECGYTGKKWDFMKGNVRGAFSCPACGEGTDNPNDWGITENELSKPDYTDDIRELKTKREFLRYAIKKITKEIQSLKKMM
jgi:hypothetical protein